MASGAFERAPAAVRVASEPRAARAPPSAERTLLFGHWHRSRDSDIAPHTCLMTSDRAEEGLELNHSEGASPIALPSRAYEEYAMTTHKVGPSETTRRLVDNGNRPHHAKAAYAFLRLLQGRGRLRLCEATGG